MAEYKTPGVYVEEISTFPASVVRVATAVPVFIGYTELLPSGFQNVAFKIKSMAEYVAIYGGEPTSTDRPLKVYFDAIGKVTKVEVSLKFYLYSCLRSFYANGGGDAYILSVGKYSTAPATDALKQADLTAALSPLEEVDEPTLVLIPDAYAFTSTTSLGVAQADVLAHCNKMQDRFGILDVKMGADVSASAAEFRTRVGSLNLKYGAAYFPEFLSTFGPDGRILVSDITFAGSIASLAALAAATSDPAFTLYNAAPADLALLPSRASLDVLKSNYATIALTNNKIEVAARASKIDAVMQVLYGLRTVTTLTNPKLISLIDATIKVGGWLEPKVRDLLTWDLGWAVAPPAAQTALGSILASTYNTTAPIYTGLPTSVTLSPAIYGIGGTVSSKAQDSRPAFDAMFASVFGMLDAIITLAEVLKSDDNLFASSKVMADVRDAIRATGYTLPPCGAIAGVYASVDASRGVWKAPANVSINGVASVIKMTTDELDDLNISASTGKSINAIRLFRGQGILVYGARTLAGNDNEWRYVPVRRLFNMVEESVKKATEPFVFEPNDANTWLRIKNMIENFLFTLWRDGALAGAVPTDAFYVKVGLGQTMTAQDILNGFLYIEIGMAAVRPAEFVVLKFSHKLQES